MIFIIDYYKLKVDICINQNRKEMKTYKGQIDETWTEVDLTQFKKENPKYAPKTYKESIIEVTGCNPKDADEIEEYMRNIYFHSTLDWQSKAQFNKGARESYKDILWMRSPEGVEYMKQLAQ